jgi:hypothetical protein
MNEQKFDAVTPCMLLGLAIGALLYQVSGQTLFIAAGLGAGLLCGMVLSWVIGRSTGPDEWPDVAAGAARWKG